MKKTSEMLTKPRSEVLALAALCICIVITSLGLSNRSAEAALATAVVSPAAAPVGTLPAAPLLNYDGTLNLRTGASGAVDMAGWRVSLDPRRGPVFVPYATTAGPWSSLGNGVKSFVYALAVSGSDVYVGGDFSEICGNAACDSGNVTVNHIAHWNGSTWSALGSGVDNTVYAIAVSGSDVYVGGVFIRVCGDLCLIGNNTVNHVAIWNGSAWSALGSGVNNYVNAIAVSGSDVYVGGQFTQVCGNYICSSGNTTVNYVAHWDGSTWSALYNGVNSPVYALTMSGGDVYVGGDFTMICGYQCLIGNNTVNYVAKWNGSAWSALGSGVDGYVFALAVNGNDVYAGGAFNHICGDYLCNNNSGNTMANHVSHWDSSTWSALGNGVDAVVNAIAVSGSDVYVGGGFTQVCGNSTCTSILREVNNIAKWNSGTWFSVGNGVDSNVYALAASGSDVYAGGVFAQFCGDDQCSSGNSAVNRVGRYSSLPSFNVFLPLTER